MDKYYVKRIKKRIKDIRKMLDEKRDDWELKYKEYCEIFARKSKRLHISGDPEVNSPIDQYMTITLDDSLVSLRYKGQIVGKLDLSGEETELCIEKNTHDHNKSYFELDIPEGNYAWRASTEAEIFRTCFGGNPEKENIPVKTIESALVSYIESNSQIELEPVKLAGKRFYMPAPFSVYNSNNIHFCNSAKQGVMNVLAISGRSQKNLTVIKVGSSNERGAVKDALLKAVSHGAFLCELIRSDRAGGEQWLKNFSISRELKESETIRCLVAIPDIKNDTKEMIERINDRDSFSIGKDKLEIGFLSLDPKSYSVISS